MAKQVISPDVQELLNYEFGQKVGPSEIRRVFEKILGSRIKNHKKLTRIEFDALAQRFERAREPSKKRSTMGTRLKNY